MSVDNMWLFDERAARTCEAVQIGLTMLALPQQTSQQKSESDSFAILVYKLRGLGIFRNVTANDFGIDFEIELISEGNVTGRLIKAQIKSKRSFRVDRSSQAAVGGVEQSTLNYWLSVSKHCPVIIFGVDLATEDIYYSEPIYQQAAALLDGTDATKTVKLRYRFSGDSAGLMHLRLLSLDYGYEAKQLMHEEALLQLDYLRQSYKWRTNNTLDHGTELFDAERFPWLLRTGRALLGYEPLIKHCQMYGLDLARFYDVGYWIERSEQLSGVRDLLLHYEGTRKHIPFLARLLIKYLRRRREAMLGVEACYWVHEDPRFLNMVFEFHLERSKYTRWYPGSFNVEFVRFVEEQMQAVQKRIELRKAAKFARQSRVDESDGLE